MPTQGLGQLVVAQWLGVWCGSCERLLDLERATIGGFWME